MRVSQRNSGLPLSGLAVGPPKNASNPTFSEKYPMLRTTYQKIESLTIEDICRMHALFEANYANGPLDTFITDLRKKDGAFVVRKKATQEIVGFSTLGIYEFKFGGKKAKGLFSGDTILERAYWGTRSLQSAFAFKLFIEAIKAPLTPQYWLLISKGYKTYLLMARNFPDYYPKRGQDNPAMQSLVSEYCEALFPGKLDPVKMVLDFGDGANCLKEDVAQITDSLRSQDPDVRFFEERNPGWQRGTELPCIAATDLMSFLRIIGPFLWKALTKRSKGRAPVADQVVDVSRARSA